jgi:hypothetical protein
MTMSKGKGARTQSTSRSDQNSGEICGAVRSASILVIRQVHPHFQSHLFRIRLSRPTSGAEINPIVVFETALRTRPVIVVLRRCMSNRRGVGDIIPNRIASRMSVMCIGRCLDVVMIWTLSAVAVSDRHAGPIRDWSVRFGTSVASEMRAGGTPFRSIRNEIPALALAAYPHIFRNFVARTHRGHFFNRSILDEGIEYR